LKIEDWVGRTETRTDVVTAAPVAALSATLDRADPPPKPGDPLPLLWHWLYFLPVHRQSDLGPDGHARLGDFLPPVPLPRRMYAGGRVSVHHSLRVGDAITRVSRIADVTQKEGRSGPLVFVHVRHEISNAQGLALTEDHDIVYRDRPKDAEAARADACPEDARWSREIRADDVLLFRYSALTFNGYRIHYDRPFAMGIQGYPGLVVHGPLIATLLADLLRRSLPEATISSFSFRAISALVDSDPFFVCGRPNSDGRTVTLWARDADGALAVEATATVS
jgi:3-methylfumaryl-CoA hydratase